MIWKKRNINDKKMIDSKELSQNTMEIKFTDDQRKLLENAVYSEEFEEYKIQKKIAKNKIKKIYIILITLLVVTAATFSFVYVRYLSRITKLENEAQRYIDEYNHKGASEIYKLIYEETGDVEYLNKSKSLSKHLENESTIRYATEMIKSDDFETAIELLFTISTDDEKTIKRINELVEDSSELWLNMIEDDYKNGRIDSSYSEIERFINLIPNNERALILRNSIIEKRR